MAQILVQRHQHTVVAGRSFVRIESVLGELCRHADVIVQYTGDELDKVRKVSVCDIALHLRIRVNELRETWPHLVFKPGLWCHTSLPRTQCLGEVPKRCRHQLPGACAVS